MYKKEYTKQLEDVKEWHDVNLDLLMKDQQQTHDNMHHPVFNLDILLLLELSMQLGLSKNELTPTADMDKADWL